MKLIVTLFAALALAASAHGDALAAPSSDTQTRSAQAKAKAKTAKSTAAAKAKSSKARRTAAKAAPVAAAAPPPWPASSIPTTSMSTSSNGSRCASSSTRWSRSTASSAPRWKRCSARCATSISAVQLVKPAPPGKPKNWQAYSARFIEPIRIKAGVRFWEDNAEALKRAEAAYGVPAEIIVGIIGIETIYGRDTGRFRVLDSLTTLAFAYPDAPNQAARQAFFRDELDNTLLLAREHGYRSVLAARFVRRRRRHAAVHAKQYPEVWRGLRQRRPDRPAQLQRGRDRQRGELPGPAWLERRASRPRGVCRPMCRPRAPGSPCSATAWKRRCARSSCARPAS